MKLRTTNLFQNVYILKTSLNVSKMEGDDYYYFLWLCSPVRVMASSFTRFRDHTHDAPQSVGLLWTSDQLVAETSTRQHATLTKQTNIHASGKIRSHDRSRRTALDRASTGTGRERLYVY
jgi:hypothetical protein